MREKRTTGESGVTRKEKNRVREGRARAPVAIFISPSPHKIKLTKFAYFLRG